MCQKMNSSTDDEIAEIERSARCELMSHQTNNSNSSLNNTAASGNRVASMGSVDTYNSDDFVEGDLLVNFPSRGASTSSQVMGGYDGGTWSSYGKAKQRNSVSLNPMDMRAALAGLSDLVDSDDDDDKTVKKEKAPSPPQVSNPKASGGPDHRPLVGGFAAAAYEASRVDYYKKQGKDVRGHQAPKARPQYPRYP